MCVYRFNSPKNFKGWARWSKEDEKTLKELSDKKYTDAKIGKILGRSRTSIQKRREQLGILKPLCEMTIIKKMRKYGK